MQGENSKENQEKLVDYYDKYVSRQKRIGVNLRHKSIAEKMIYAGVKPGDCVLEIGCGIGTFSGLLSELIPQGKALCLDISNESILEAQREVKNSNLTFACANAVEHDFKDQTFDAIVLPDVIEHIPIEFHDQLFKNLSTILKPNGFVLIHIPNPYYLEWCHEHLKEALQIIDQPIFTGSLIENTYKHGFHIHELKTYSIWIEDCDYQYITLKKNGYQDFNKTIEEKPSLMEKIKYKLNARKK